MTAGGRGGGRAGAQARASATDARCRDAEALLERAGVTARVQARGFDGSIAAVRASAADLPTVREQAAAIRNLGFRYVALELTGHGAETAETGPPRGLDEHGRQ